MGYIEAYKRACEDVGSAEKRMLLPVSGAKGMPDFVKDVLGSNAVNYCEWTYWVLFDSSLKIGGYLQYNGGTDCPLCDEVSRSWYRACMEAYDKYLCSDGRIRCVKDEESDKRFQELSRIYANDFWDGLNKSFEASGMYYDSVLGYWLNPETGDDGCY